MIVLRARSRVRGFLLFPVRSISLADLAGEIQVERDEWLWALNVAISRLQEGSDREREQQLKEFKWLDSVKPIKS